MNDAIDYKLLVYLSYSYKKREEMKRAQDGTKCFESK